MAGSPVEDSRANAIAAIGSWGSEEAAGENMDEIFVIIFKNKFDQHAPLLDLLTLQQNATITE